MTYTGGILRQVLVLGSFSVDLAKRTTGPATKSRSGWKGVAVCVAEWHYFCLPVAIIETTAPSSGRM